LIQKLSAKYSLIQNYFSDASANEINWGVLQVFPAGSKYI